MATSFVINDGRQRVSCVATRDRTFQCDSGFGLAVRDEQRALLGARSALRRERLDEQAVLELLEIDAVAGSSNSFPALTALVIAEKSRASRRSPSESSIARSITLRSSRTLPGYGHQECVGGRCCSEHPLPKLGIERVDEIHEKRHIVDMRPQGRDDDG